MVLLASGPRIHSAGAGSGIGVWAYLLNQPEVIARYLRLAVWPKGLIAIYGWPNTHISTAQMWPYGAIIVAVFVASIAWFIVRPRAGLLGIWFFVTLAPASSIVPIATEVGAERRMYMPLMGLATLAVLGLWRARGSRARPAWHDPMWLALGIMAAALGTTTFARNREYASERQLAELSLAQRPTDQARHLLGVALVHEGNADAGIEMLRQATATDPRAYYDLGLALCDQRRPQECIAALQVFLEREPLLLEVINARLTMARAFAELRQWDRVIDESRNVLHMRPANREGRAQLYAGLLNRGVELVGSGDVHGAIALFREAASLDPASADAQRNLALAYFDSGDMRQAAEHARAGLGIRPDDGVMKDVLRDATR